MKTALRLGAIIFLLCGCAHAVYAAYVLRGIWQALIIYPHVAWLLVAFPFLDLLFAWSLWPTKKAAPARRRLRIAAIIFLALWGVTAIYGNLEVEHQLSDEFFAFAYPEMCRDTVSDFDCRSAHRAMSRSHLGQYEMPYYGYSQISAPGPFVVSFYSEYMCGDLCGFGGSRVVLWLPGPWISGFEYEGWLS